MCIRDRCRATPDDRALPFVDPELVADPAVFPPQEMLAGLEVAADTFASSQRIEVWHEFGSKVGQGRGEGPPAARLAPAPQPA